MFTCAFAEIVSIDNRILSVKPLGAMGGVTPPVIHDVPLGLLGNIKNHTDHKLVIGDIIIILFTTMDIGNYISFGSSETVPSLELNSYNSAVALPITFNQSQLGLALPESISQIGDVLHKGDTKHNGNTNQSGSLIVSEKITTQELLVNGKAELKGGTTIQGKPFLEHSHSGVEKGPNNTGGVS